MSADGGTRWGVVAIAILSAAAARVVARVALADVPHVMDEIAYLFEAKLMAAGTVATEPALPRAAFNMWFVEDRHARFGIFPPGWPAILALGVRLGATHWVNPALHAATVILVGRAAGRAAGPRAEIAAALLYGASPQAILLAASLMSHALVALAAAVVAFVMATWSSDAPERAPTAERRLLALAGLAIGIAIVTRPLCAVVIAAPLVAMVVARSRDLRRIVPIAAAAAPFALALGAFHRALTGSALRFPQTAYFDEHLAPSNVPFFTYGKGCNSLGFGAACDHTVRDAVHTPLSAWTDAGDNLRAWAILIAAPVVLVGVGRLLLSRHAEPDDPRRLARWMILPPALAVMLYGLYWQAGVCYGARFYHAALPALLVAAGVGLATIRRRELLGLSLAGALVLDAGGFVVSAREITSWSWWGTDDRFAALVRDWREGRSVVMVAFGQDDVKNPRLVATGAASPGTWLLGIRALGALAQNAPRPADGEVVFAKFHPALVGELAERFPGRRLWLYTAWADRSKDSLEPWDPSRFAGHDYRRPADNFDGFRVGPPYELPDPLLREPTDEGWPP